MTLMQLLRAHARAIGEFLCVSLIGVLAAQPMLRYGLVWGGGDALWHIQRTARIQVKP